MFAKSVKTISRQGVQFAVLVKGKWTMDCLGSFWFFDYPLRRKGLDAILGHVLQ